MSFNEKAQPFGTLEIVNQKACQIKMVNKIRIFVCNLCNEGFNTVAKLKENSKVHIRRINIRMT